MAQKKKGGSSEGSPGAESGASSPDRYVVLARRYRPRQFDQVVGQQHVTRTLQNAITAGRVHHAYLFTGSRGVGKTTVARILSRALNCEEGPTPTPCDRCSLCRDKGSAVDLFEIDGASHTGVDDIRELRENVRYLPAQARNKIYIIDEVHMLSTSAFNALLKTLEEPPPHVVFIFATTEPHKIPATILSRCQRFDFKRVQIPELVTHLQHVIANEGVRVEEAGLAVIARASEGSVRDALSLLDQVIAHEVSGAEAEISAVRVAEVLGMPDRRVLFELSAAVLDRDATAALTVVDRLFGQGQDLPQFSQAFLTHLRDLVVVRSCKEPRALLDVTEVELTELGQQASEQAGELLQQHFDRFARAAEEIARSSYPRLLLEMALLEMLNAEPLLPLGGLLERLESLESRLGGAPGAPGGGGGGGGARPSPGRRGLGGPGPSSSKVAVAPPATAAPQPSSPPARDAPPPAAAGGPVAAPPPSGDNGANGAGSTQQVVGGSPLERWQRLQKQVEREHPVLASAYVNARMLAWGDDGKIDLGYPPGSFDLVRAEDRDRRTALGEICSRLVGKPIEITVRPMRPEEEASPELVRMSVAQEKARMRAERAEKLRQEAEGHPITQAFLQRFGAKIQRIRTQVDGED